MNNINFLGVIIFLLGLTDLPFAQEKITYLSNLSATKDSPLFTTYAAAMERSEFTLDEGYHFLFYDSSRGIDFTTDTGGDLCLAFKIGADYVYESKDLYQQPVITVSYPDMVKYHYTPYENLQVDATFLVYSSHIAVHDVILKNSGKQAIDLQVIPFLQNNYRVFNNVAFHPQSNAITFSHEELPDSWVLGHDVPYINPVQDVFLLSRKPDRMTSYRSYKWGHIQIPHEVDIEKKPVYVVWGRISHPDGERCQHRSPMPQIMVILNNDPTKILTATAPRWGSADESISSYGYYGIELGNFGDLKNGDVYTITFLCRETGESATITDTIKNLSKENSIRKDLTLSKRPVLSTPKDIDRDIWGSGTEMRLFWKHGDKNVTFNIYRRDYRKNG
ncbi:MAG: hypothetical protein KAW56_02620, partial [Candidatus Marinimicrobia bacterium]|nr:hypothetical protein [Candidatus Neomarinimicrobiota bacterium]